MKLIWLFLCAWALFVSPNFAEAIKPQKADSDCIVMLHGLARSASSFNKMEERLQALGYQVVNVDYPSRKQRIESLANEYIPLAIKSCGDKQIHFVTHSMGGILVRYYLAHNVMHNLGRVVMLSPPSQGSEVVDKLGNMPGFDAFHGPAGKQLSTSSESMPNKLGAVDYPVGIITGNRSINLILSALIPGDDDGKVSIERARLEGMTDFLVMPHTHPMIMRSDEVIRQTVLFLQQGKFDDSVK